MKNKSILLLLIFILNGCIAYHRSGYISPKNWFYETKVNQYGDYKTSFNLDISEPIYLNSNSKKITLELPQKITDDRCMYVAGFIIPFYFSKDCGQSWIDKQHNFSVSMYSKYYTNEFKTSLSLSLLVNGQEYQSKKIFDTSYLVFRFPIPISYIESYNSELIIKHKNYKKEIPIQYEMKWNGLGK